MWIYMECKLPCISFSGRICMPEMYAKGKYKAFKTIKKIAKTIVRLAVSGLITAAVFSVGTIAVSALGANKEIIAMLMLFAITYLSIFPIHRSKGAK